MDNGSSKPLIDEVNNKLRTDQRARAEFKIVCFRLKAYEFVVVITNFVSNCLSELFIIHNTEEYTSTLII